MFSTLRPGDSCSGITWRSSTRPPSTGKRCLNCTLPGAFLPEHNYLSFANADECVTGVERLFAEPELTANLMSANADYYQRFLRPDKLVMNSLRGVLADVQEVSEVV